MGPADAAKYHQQLLELRQRLQSEVARIEDAIPEKMSRPGENSHVPTHPADRDVAGLDEDLAVVQAGADTLQAIDSALQRLAAGVFGQCECCGKPIAPQRLDAVPYTPFCIDCARKME